MGSETNGHHSPVIWGLLCILGCGDGFSPGRTPGHSVGGSSRRGKESPKVPLLPAPFRSLLPGPAGAGQGLGGCRTLPSIRGLRFSAVRERCSVPLLPRLLPVCWSLHALPIKPCGPWPWGASWCCVQVGRCPWRRMGQLGGRCSAGPPLPRLHPSLTLACPSRPESNSPCSATLSGVSPAPGDVSEPTCHFLQ